MELFPGSVAKAHARPVGPHGVPTRAAVQDQLGGARDDLIQGATQGLDHPHPGDLLGLGIEIRDVPVPIRGQEPAHDALDRALVQIPQADQVVGASIEGLTRAPELAREHARERAHQEERADVDPPDGGEGRVREGLPTSRHAARRVAVGDHQDRCVADGAQGRGAHRAPTLEEQGAVDGDEHVEEGEERLVAAREAHERRHDAHVEGDLEGREAVQVPQPSHQRRRDRRGPECERHRPEEADAGAFRQLSAGPLQTDGDGEAHPGQHQPAEQQPLGPLSGAIPEQRRSVRLAQPPAAPHRKTLSRRCRRS